MIRYLLPKEGKFYKANLHCHSVLSDGKKTPEQLKEMYKNHGYSVLAITDHEFMVDHTDMTEPDFLMLNGYEAYVKEQTDPTRMGRYMKTAHINFIAKDPTVRKHIMVDAAYQKYSVRTMKVEDLPRVGDITVRQYTPGDINRMVRQANENGYFAFYNHPVWSRENRPVVLQYEGFIGAEVYNHGVYNTEGYSGDDGKAYDDFLQAGRRMYPFCNDDNHNKFPDDSPLCDSFGGFNMIKAEKLDYATIVDAILKGDFYCSYGPTIDELYMEDDTVHITFPEAREVFLVTEGRASAPGRSPHVVAKKGESLTEASFQILPEDRYFRLEVVDHEGHKAFTRAFFLEDLK